MFLVKANDGEEDDFMRKAYGVCARSRVASRAAWAGLALLVVAATALSASPSPLAGSRAFAASSGKTNVEDVGMVRHWSGGQHSDKHLLKIGDEWVYCMQGGKDFQTGLEVKGKDAVESGKLSQKCVTDLALAYEYVWVHDLYRKPSGKKLSTKLERYAAAQVLMWRILLKYGEDDGPSHSSISINGEDITGDVDESSNNKKAFEWIAEKRGEYIGYCTYYTASGAQNFALGFKTEPKLGAIELAKRSSNATLSDGNACYSLKGAVYGVFGSKSDAQSHSASKALKTFTTDSSGAWKSDEEFKQGSYYVSEISPSAGYLLDELVYAVEVKPGATVKVNGASGVLETPVDSAFEVLLAKWDADLDRAVRQGAASLEGAEFSVCFYGGYYEASDLPKAKRSWVLRTDATGIVDFQDALAHKVSGDDFYRNANGKICMPLGTVSVVETKAPTGYNLGSAGSDEPQVFVFQVVQDPSSPTGASQQPLNYSGKVTESNTPVMPDIVKRGDYRLVKEVAVEISQDEPQEQERVLLQGIQFQLVNDNDGVVVSPETGEEVDCGGVVCTMTADENGLASTRAGADVNGWDIPEGWTAALAYGTYRVREIIPDDVQERFQQDYGKKLLPVDEWKVTISEEGQFDGAALVNNRIPQSPLKVVKVDEETGQRIPLPMSFQLYDEEGELVTYTAQYPEKTTLDTWTANERGEATLPMLLEQGTYYIQEIEAPDGYVLDPERIEFTVDEYRTWEDPIEIAMEDMPIKGIIELQKADAETGAAIAGAQYVIAAAEDIVTPDGTLRMETGKTAALVTTDAEGRATSPELYLGAYKVYEAKSPAGYALDRDEHGVAIISQGQDVPVVEVGIELLDAPTTLRLVKVDAKTGELLPGAKFRIWGDGGIAQGGADEPGGEGEGEPASGDAGDGDDDGADDAEGQGASEAQDQPDGQGASDEGGEAPDEVAAEEDDGGSEEEGASGEDGGEGAPAFELELQADELGIAELPYLVPGSYHVKETEAPAGHYIAADAEQFDFRVDDQGLVGLVGASVSDVLELTIENAPCEIGTTATVDGFQRAHVSGKVELVDTVAYKGCVPGEQYTVTGVLHKVAYDDVGGKVDGGSVAGANGEPLSVEVSFTPQAVEGAVDVVFRFDASGLEGSEVVAFEEMRHGSELFATHADIADENQTVFFEPEVATTLTDKKTGNHTARVAKKCQLVDVVAYRGLSVGHTYKIIGTLVNASTGQPLRKGNGKEVTASKSFACKSADGKVKLTFKLDSRQLAGSSAVAFETVMEGDEIVAAHADLSDAAQTVTFPKAKTSAADAADGDKIVKPGEDASVVDTVSYSGLTPGQKYEVRGVLHAVKTGKGGKRSDGGALEDASGKAVEAKTTFTPKAADGSVKVVFAFDASKLDGAGAVAFEELFHIPQKGKAVKLVSHADIGDADQYVSFGDGEPLRPATRGSSSSGLPQTGDMLFRAAAGLMCAGLLALAATVIAYRRKTRLIP